MTLPLRGGSPERVPSCHDALLICGILVRFALRWPAKQGRHTFDFWIIPYLRRTNGRLFKRGIVATDMDEGRLFPGSLVESLNFMNEKKSSSNLEMT